MPTPLRIFDGHLDLAMNATMYDRDQTWPLDRLREREAGQKEKDPERGGLLCVSLPEMRTGGVAMFTGTLFTRAAPGAKIEKNLKRIDADWATPALAHAQAAAQLAYYRLLERQGQLCLVTSAGELEEPGAARFSGLVPAPSKPTAPKPIPMILLMEGADALATPNELEFWHAGVRALGLTHYPANTYASGNAADGPLTAAGHELLKVLRRLNMSLDISHLADTSIAGALDAFDGPVFASHCNCRALAPNPRQLTDTQIRSIAIRGGIVGVVLHNKMLGAKWEPPMPRSAVPLSRVVDHIDHICQLAGDAGHVGLGSDLDGGYGTDRCPDGIESIADLGKLAPLLSDRRFGDDDVAAILFDNWVAFWRTALT